MFCSFRPVSFRPVALLAALTTLSTTTLISVPAYGQPPTLPLIFQDSFDPPGDDAPDHTVGAGSRTNSACPGDGQALRSHMPERNYGLTTQSRPGVYVQLPETRARRVLLAFRNEAGTYYERTFLPVPDTGSLLRFALPESAAPLAIGDNYEWTLVLVCGETVQPDDPILTGWVQRTAAQDYALDAHWLAQNGYWYDLLDALYQVSMPEVAVQIGPLMP